MSEKTLEELIEFAGMLVRQHVTTAGNDGELGARDQGRQTMRHRRGRAAVVLAGDDQGRNGKRAEPPGEIPVGFGEDPIGGEERSRIVATKRSRSATAICGPPASTSSTLPRIAASGLLSSCVSACT